MIVLDQPESQEKNGWKSPEQVLNDGYSFDFGTLFNDAFEIFKKGALHFILFLILSGAMNLVVSLIPFFGIFGSIILNPPLTVGFFIVAEKIRKGEPYEFGNFFDGFRMNFGNLVLTYFISALFIFLGTLFCILPGIWLAVSYMLAMPIVLFLNLEFWDALEASRKIVAMKFWLFLGTILLMGLAALICVALTCGLGFVIVGPMMSLMVYAMFVRIFKPE